MGGRGHPERIGGELLMTDYLTNDTELTAVANAIRTRGGTSAALEWPDGYVDAVEAIPGGGGGGDEDFKAVIEGNAVNPVLPAGLTKIRKYAFYQMTALEEPSIPDTVTAIEMYAFSGCTNLKLTSLPAGLTSINTYAFQNCRNMRLASLPSGLRGNIGNYTFYGCANITLTSLPAGVNQAADYSFTNCTNLALTSLPSGVGGVGVQAFQNCINMPLASLGNSLMTIGNSAFYHCKSMCITSLPSTLTSIGQTAFQGCISIRSLESTAAITSMGTSCFTGTTTYRPMLLERVSFPNMSLSTLSTSFGSTTAANACMNLEVADVGTVGSIAANAFANCNKLTTLVLRKTNAITSLANVSAFLNTPMRGYGGLTGTVYVPAARLANYQTASNWKTLYNAGTVTFVAIEGSEYEL